MYICNVHNVVFIILSVNFGCREVFKTQLKKTKPMKKISILLILISFITAFSKNGINKLLYFIAIKFEVSKFRIVKNNNKNYFYFVVN